ncbi:MAG: type I-U CRISPR-associated protein Csb2, partial [Pseudomonadota bacterium]
MSRHLVLSFRFLSPWFHGRGDEGTPEWPPSPFRAFQAVVAAAGRAGTLESTRGALTWLEQRAAPLVIASEATESATGYRLSVPHNAMDLVGEHWSRGDHDSEAARKKIKELSANSTLSLRAAENAVLERGVGHEEKACTVVGSDRRVLGA